VSPISICFTAISGKGSPNPPCTSCSRKRPGTKRIIESMESARDKVTVMTCLCSMPNKVCTLNPSRSIARQQLLEDSMFLSLPQMSLPPSSRNVKEAAIAANFIRKLKAMPSDTKRYQRADEIVHLFLLTSQLDHGAIDLPPEVIMGQMQINTLGIGPVLMVRNEMGSSGWRVSLNTSGPRLNIKDSRSEPMPITVEEIVSTLRAGVSW